MVWDKSGWMMSGALELRILCLTVLLDQLELTTVATLKMLESAVEQVCILSFSCSYSYYDCYVLYSIKIFVIFKDKIFCSVF